MYVQIQIHGNELSLVRGKGNFNVACTAWWDGDFGQATAQPYNIRGIEANYFNIVTPPTVSEVETGFTVTSIDCKSGISCNKDINTPDGGKAFEPKLQLSGKKIQMVDQTGAIKSEVDLSSLIP